ncbi:MAG: hypothetical protein WCI86_01790 [Actinomycetota bacterium]
MKEKTIKFAAIANLIILTLFSIAPTTPAQAADSFVYTDFAANDFGLWSQSSLYGQDRLGSTKLEDWKQLWCSGWDDPTCKVYDNLFSDLILSPCVNDADRACLESVEAKNSTGALEKLTLYGEATSQKISAYKFKSGATVTDLPAGGGLSVWKSSEKNSDGSDKFYAAHILLRYIATSKKSGLVAEDQIVLSDFKGQVYPVTLKPGGICKEFAIATQCVNSANFSGSENLAVTLRMNKSLTGWIFGRMQNAEFSVAPLDDSYNKIRIGGDVTLVPELKALVAKSDISKDSKLEKYLKDLFTVGPVGLSVPNPGLGSWNDGNIGGRQSTTYDGFLSAQTTTRLFSVNFEKFALFAAFEDQLKPFSPPASNNGRNILRETNSIFWNFGANSYIGNNKCSADKTKLHGMVVTNAPIYENGPPEFKDGSLNYRVAGIHNNVDGSEFKGRYTYIVRSDTARCYYGFSNAPIEARVEVVSANSSNQVASVLVSEKDGFLKLQADNFTFSSPTIKMKFLQTAETKPATPAIATPVEIPAKKILSITCIKGKVTKKVSGVSPKCPSGYKKK